MAPQKEPNRPPGPGRLTTRNQISYQLLHRWLALSVLCLTASALGADWPTWRCDTSRSAVSSEALPDQLHLRWSRQLPPVAPAWPHEARLHFDASYEPVVLGKTLFLGSPNDGSVTAFDTETGETKWRFLAEGPVRFAPVAWRGKVYVGSDDGYLYCLRAADGQLRWRVRAAPNGLPYDRRHLGNGRLISFWPVRGGPVLANGTVYFAAGIWPTLGVFILAVDAESGRVLWRNSEAHYIENVRVDHNELHDTGLSPQGYLAVAGNKLVVPNGRSMPARLDRATGKLLYYVQGYRNGDCRVAVTGNYAFVGDAGVVDVATGREVGSRWAAAGKDAPKAFDIKKFDLFEGPIFPYKMFPGCTARSVLASGTVYGSHRGTFYAYDLSRPSVSEYETKLYGTYEAHPWRWDVPRLWKLRTEHAKGKPVSDVLIKAGNRLYGHAGKMLLALDIPAAGAQPKVAWRQPLDGTPSSMAAADGKLFVATKEGGLYCLGAKQADVKTFPLKATPLPKADDRWTAAAAKILRQTKVAEGYCLVLGIGSGRLAEELLQQSKLKLVVVDSDARKAHALRERLTAAGLYGSRSEVFIGEPLAFTFPPYLASLIISQTGLPNQAARDRLFEVLRPYGGAICSMQGNTLSVVRRDGPLAGSAAWTHECADAARSYFSHDQRVKLPLGILWYGQCGQDEFWSNNDYGIGVKPQVVGGRVFAYSLPRRSLFAYDAYTGRHLWKVRTDPFARFASTADGIYVACGDCCTVHDPATGAVLAKFQFRVSEGGTGVPPVRPASRKPIVSDIRVADGIILIAAAFEKVRSIEKGLWDSTLFVALDRRSGRTLWQRKAKHRFNNHALAIGGGVVYCIDSPSPIDIKAAKRRGDLPPVLPSDLLALDPRSGNVRWSTTIKHRTSGMGSWISVRSNDDWLAYAQGIGLLLTGKFGAAHVFDAASGKPAWQGRVGPQPIILRGETFIDQGGNIFQTRTGKAAGKVSLSPRGGCNYAVGAKHLLFLRNRTVCCIDPATQAKHYLRNVRSGCSNSLVAADGLLNVPNYAVGCVCNYPIQTAFAMVHMPEVAAWAGKRPLRLTDESAAPPKE